MNIVEGFGGFLVLVFFSKSDNCFLCERWLSSSLSTEEGPCCCSSQQATAAVAQGLLGGRAVGAWHLSTVGAGRYVSMSLPDGMGLVAQVIIKLICDVQ